MAFSEHRATKAGIVGASVKGTLPKQGEHMTIERLFPSGGYLIYTIHKGYFFSRRYFGYTKKEAVQQFRQEVRGK